MAENGSITHFTDEYIYSLYCEKVKPRLDDIKRMFFEGYSFSEISKELDVSRASVTDALHRLADKEYIHYERYGSIEITKKGIDKAREVIDKHTILTNFFENILNLTHEEASENACRIEHVITSNAFKKLKEYTATKIG